MSALVTPEGYADLCTTTLTAGYTAGAGAITVASTGAPFPQVQQFHFFIQDQTTLAVKAVGKATAITSGTVWAVTMSTDANANSGDFVKLALAQDAMDQIRKDLVQAGTNASLPSTTGQKQGNLYLDTDQPVIYRFDGSAWKAFGYGVLASLYVDAAEASTSTTFGDLATLDTVTFSLLATANVTIKYGATQSTNKTNQVAYNIPNVDGSDAAVQNNAVVFAGNASLVYFGGCVYKTSLASGSHTIKIRHKISDNSAGGNATWQARLLEVSLSP